MTQLNLPDMGPLNVLLADPDVTEIMCNRHDILYVEKNGQLIRVNAAFRDNDHVMEIITIIGVGMGRLPSESHPIMDYRLPDGSRMHVVIPPIAIGGATFNIRKFKGFALTLEQLIEKQCLTSSIATFLQACVTVGLNILVTGGTGSGKTTLLNILTNMIPSEERIFILENAGELQVDKPNVVTLETRPPNFEGRGEISMYQLVDSALKMRPERLIMGDTLRGSELAAMLGAINTGHNGSMFTVTANAIRDCLSRMEILMSEANPSQPILTHREQIGSSIDIMLHVQRLRDGQRRLMTVTNIIGIHNSEIAVENIFEYRESYSKKGISQGNHAATGNLPHFLKRLRETGMDLPDELFTA